MVFGSLRQAPLWRALTETPRAWSRHADAKLAGKAGSVDWAWRLTVARTVAVGLGRCLGRLASGLLFAAVCVGVLLLAALSFGWPLPFLHLPVELFYWPQAAVLGGAGFPPPSALRVGVVLHRCPARRPPRWPDAAVSLVGTAGEEAAPDAGLADGDSIRRGPRSEFFPLSNTHINKSPRPPPCPLKCGQCIAFRSCCARLNKERI